MYLSKNEYTLVCNHVNYSEGNCMCTLYIHVATLYMYMYVYQWTEAQVGVYVIQVRLIFHFW